MDSLFKEAFDKIPEYANNYKLELRIGSRQNAVKIRANLSRYSMQHDDKYFTRLVKNKSYDYSLFVTVLDEFISTDKFDNEKPADMELGEALKIRSCRKLVLEYFDGVEPNGDFHRIKFHIKNDAEKKKLQGALSAFSVMNNYVITSKYIDGFIYVSFVKPPLPVKEPMPYTFQGNTN